MNGARYKKESVAAVAFVILDLTILALGGWFLTSKIISASSQLTEEIGILEATQKSWDQIMHSQKDLLVIKPELARIDGAFVSANEPIEFINLLENLAQKTSNLFEINLMSLAADPKKKDKESALVFQIRLSGSYTNLMHFLSYLENMKYETQVQSVDISASPAGALQASNGQQISANNVNSVINLKVYTQ
jgi:hypothetical protein